ncbi:glycosyl hydrolase family 16 [Pseudonocardia sediminis]|uniref:Glycosyl hydrolase family 16 n=1 Tax=Pseudonocardia sediminis TaxID=1397368 RepID=A0A4Q7UBM1_PSEST|nr:glycoside hydrolase family 16 protein [Pseudonocardia sediminis]RZT75481.1 glycosyl hydrolase family 16 [Pseudonocardia sediminis]
MGPNLLVSASLAAATTLAATVGITPAAPADNVSCAWRITSVHVLAELTGDNSPRARQLREALIGVGANKPGFVPDQCLTSSGSGGGGQDSGGGSNQGGDQSGSSGQDSQGSGGQDSGGQDSGGQDSGGQDSGGQDSGGQDSGGAGTGQDGGGQSSGQGTTAADALGWGQPDKVDDFTNGVEGWNLYDGPGHAGNGTRSPDAASVKDGILTINGTGDGTTAGMAWGDGQKYGRWEGRMKAPTGSPSYNALFLLWPDEENFPVGGEIDFAEISDSARKKVDIFLHYGEDNSQVQGDVEVDATQWNNWAVEWTPQGVTAYLNGKEWWKTTDTGVLPPGPMHLCIQLDWFPKGDSETGSMQVDWVKQWSLDGNGQASTGGQDGSGGSDSGGSTGDSETGGGSDSGGSDGA